MSVKPIKPFLTYSQKIRSAVSYHFCDTYFENQADYLNPDHYNTSRKNKLGVSRALADYGHKTPAGMEGSCKCSMELVENYHFEIPEYISWKGKFEENVAYWEAPSFEIASELFGEVRAYIRKNR